MEVIGETTTTINWESFPSDMICEIISEITDISDIISFMSTSKTFIKFAKLCVTQLTSLKFITVPLSNFNCFDNLIKSDKNTLLLIEKADDISVIKTMKNLIEANLYFSVNTVQDFSNMVLILIDSYLTPIEEKFETGGSMIHRRSLNNVLIRIIAKVGNDTYAVIIDNGRILMIMPEIQLTIVLSTKIKNTYKPLKINFLGLKGEAKMDKTIIFGFLAPFGMKDNLINFIKDGNFGLLDPSKPPSATNQILKSQLKNIDGKVSNSSILTTMFAIYVLTNMVSGVILTADENMRKNFENVIEEYNKTVDTYKKINLSAFRYANMQIMIMQSSIDKRSKDLIPFLSKINYFDPDELTNDENIVKNTLKIIRDLRQNNQILYLPDGSTK